MKGTNLGELEELILLATASLYDNAYGIAIQKEIKAKCNRSISISTVHAVLARLEQKGFMDSRYDGMTPERGGRRKHLFRVTKSGQKALLQVREQRETFWQGIPSIAFEK